MDSSPTTSGSASIADLWVVQRALNGYDSFQSKSRHIFAGKVNGDVGGDSYNVKDDRPSRIKFEELQEKSSCKGIADSTKPPNDDDFDCQVDETVDASAMLLYRDGILGYISVG
ncbi:hypothetical protein C5167_030113 [Papaver somniferum]|nr:hypothetical protein C5167_030113 [Papaver somniferum]